MKAYNYYKMTPPAIRKKKKKENRSFPAGLEKTLFKVFRTCYLPDIHRLSQMVRQWNRLTREAVAT